MVRRLVLALTVVAVMAGLLIGGPVVTMGDLQSGTGTAVAHPERRITADLIRRRGTCPLEAIGILGCGDGVTTPRSREAGT
jgi:hypothetical protein